MKMRNFKFFYFDENVIGKVFSKEIDRIILS